MRNSEPSPKLPSHHLKAQIAVVSAKPHLGVFLLENEDGGQFTTTINPHKAAEIAQLMIDFIEADEN